jgi:hypothetical protein
MKSETDHELISAQAQAKDQVEIEYRDIESA